MTREDHLIAGFSAANEFGELGFGFGDGDFHDGNLDHLMVQIKRGCLPHSHSIVPGGFEVTSYTTRLTPFTSLMMRVATWPMNFISKG